MTEDKPFQIHLTNAQKKQLRKLGHGLNPTVIIGKDGLRENVIEAIDAALLNHELIKVKIISTSQVTKNEAATIIPEKTASILVQLIGKTLLLFRPNSKKKKEERIKLV